MSAIQTHRLTRVFAGGQGVHDLDLDVPESAIYGFVGPNGAGKTTTIRLILGLLRSDAGEVRLFDRVLTRRDRRALSTTGALVESPSLYPHLSARDNLEVTRRLMGVPKSRIDKVLQTVELGKDAHRPVREYSLGMRQRLGIALALLNQPRLLILDEPTNGLDPAGIAAMRQLIRHLARELGVSVFLSSHLLIEVEQLASHVGVIHQGRLLFQGTIDDLRATSLAPLEVACRDSAAACADLRRAGENPEVVDGCTLRLATPRLADHEINRLLVERGHAVYRLVRREHSLEAMFFQLTENAADHDLEKAA
ncbi:MAG TPA: ABC transporter ATP-binding protein [Rhodanobacter sp.]|nr:ABC transporter ATP-binding protein [Rhodanobacter sp.]